MKLKRREFDELERCYCVAYTYIDGIRRVFFASEGPNPCYMYSGDDFVRSTVWETPGGCVDMAFIPGKERDFLAIQKFLPTFQSENAELIWGHFNENEVWEIKTLKHIPFIHHIGILRVDGVNHLVIQTLCGSKKDKEDWSDPGKVYAAVLPDDLNSPLELKGIGADMTRNHGFCVTEWEGQPAVVTTSDQGAFLFKAPRGAEEWRKEQLMDWPISDIAVLDIDEDGEAELATIEPFHGSKFLIYKRIGGQFQVVYRYPAEREFGHIVWGGKLRGVPTVIGAHRRPEKDFFYVQLESKKPLTFKTVLIDQDGGPSNLRVINEKDMDILVAPQREAHPSYGSVYYVTD